MATSYQICFITVGDEKTANAIIDGLLKNRLAACVSIIGNVSSVYWWKNKIEHAREFLLIVKTRKSLTEDIIQFVRENHTYAIPEVIFFEITHGNRDYLDWIGANTVFTRNIIKPGRLK